MVLPGFIALDPSIKVRPVFLVDGIFVGADNFHVGLGGVIHCVEGVVKYSIGGEFKYTKEKLADMFEILERVEKTTEINDYRIDDTNETVMAEDALKLPMHQFMILFKWICQRRQE